MRLKNYWQKLKSKYFAFWFAYDCILKGENEMVEIYVTLIVKGLKTVVQVPVVIRQKVKDMLIALDLQELTTEE